MSSELWSQIQQAMGYTDQELKTAMADPHRRGVLEAGPTLVRRKVVAEVVKAENCAAHKVGARYIIRGNGVIRSTECPNNMCISMLAALSPTCHVIMEKIGAGEDPKGKFASYVHCPDSGVECGGFGEAVVKVTVE